MHPPRAIYTLFFRKMCCPFLNSNVYRVAFRLRGGSEMTRYPHPSIHRLTTARSPRQPRAWRQGYRVRDDIYVPKPTHNARPQPMRKLTCTQLSILTQPEKPFLFFFSSPFFQLLGVLQYIPSFARLGIVRKSTSIHTGFPSFVPEESAYKSDIEVHKTQAKRYT